MTIQKLFSLFTLLILVISLISACDSGNSSTDSTAQAAGKSGSMARFKIVDNYLYTITTSWRLTLFDISEPSRPTLWTTIDMRGGIETLYSYKNYLFVGANNGVVIYDNSDPAKPVYTSTFSHVQSCDPVVVENNFAFATLRGGTRCRSNINQLDVIDISDITKPQLVDSIRMLEPKGLSISNNQLYVCDQRWLKGFDAFDATNLISLGEIELPGCFDIIPDRNKIIVSHLTGISQYDTSRIPISHMSTISIYK